jgi:polyketide synthase PksN
VPATPGKAAPVDLQAAVVRHLIGLLSDVTKLPADQIDARAPLENYGIDSVMILALNEKLQTTFGDVPKTLFYEHQDLQGVAGYFVETSPQQAEGLAQGQPAAVPAPQAATVDVDDADLAARQAMLLACLHEVLGAAASACTASTPLADWPLDPIAASRVAQRLQQEFADVAPNDVYRYETAARWARALQWRSARAQPVPALPAAKAAVVDRAPVQASGQANAPRAMRFPTSGASAPAIDADIAIIGLSGRYPGADNVEQFWAHLSAGKDGITEIPAVRWDHRPHFNPDRRAKGESYA